VAALMISAAEARCAHQAGVEPAWNTGRLPVRAVQRRHHDPMGEIVASQSVRLKTALPRSAAACTMRAANIAMTVPCDLDLRPYSIQ
jgi:hypothetical protein